MKFGRKKTFIEQAAEFAEDVLSTAESTIADAREKAGPRIAEARDKAGPVLADARDRAVMKAGEAREAAAPVVAEARAKAAVKAAEAREKAAPMLAEARERAATEIRAGSEKAARRFRNEPEPEPKKGAFKKLLLLSGLVAFGAVVFSKLKGGQESANWQSSYVPTPPPEPTTAPAAGAAISDDPGGAGPGEQVSDQAASPHGATTPDNPADVVEVTGDPLTDPLPEQDQRG